MCIGRTWATLKFLSLDLSNDPRAVRRFCLNEKRKILPQGGRARATAHGKDPTGEPLQQIFAS